MDSWQEGNDEKPEAEAAAGTDTGIARYTAARERRGGGLRQEGGGVGGIFAEASPSSTFLPYIEGKGKGEVGGFLASVPFGDYFSRGGVGGGSLCRCEIETFFFFGRAEKALLFVLCPCFFFLPGWMILPSKGSERKVGRASAQSMAEINQPRSRSERLDGKKSFEVLFLTGKPCQILALPDSYLLFCFFHGVL